MHRFDDAIEARLVADARAARNTLHRNLSHALIFFTAGEAVKRVVPDYVPCMERFGIWDVKLSGATLPASRFEQPLLEAWKPLLDGRGSREDALAAMLARTPH